MAKTPEIATKAVPAKVDPPPGSGTGNGTRAAVAVVIVVTGVIGATRTSLFTPESKETAVVVSATPVHEPRTYPVPGRPVMSAMAPSPMGPADAPPVEPQTDGPAELLAWTKPDAWQEVPSPSPMRKVTYKIGGDKTGGDAELGVSQAGGDLEANLQRWVGQFKDAKDPKRTKKKVGDVEVTILEIEGTYAGMAPSGGEPEAKPGWALLAAIAETSGDPYFFKLTGPKKTVDAARADFDKLVASFKKP